MTLVRPLFHDHERAHTAQESTQHIVREVVPSEKVLAEHSLPAFGLDLLREEGLVARIVVLVPFVLAELFLVVQSLDNVFVSWKFLQLVAFVIVVPLLNLGGGRSASIQRQYVMDKMICVEALEVNTRLHLYIVL